MAEPKQPEKPRELSPLERFRQKVFSHPWMREDRLPSIGRELAFAITDIRQRVFEEAWSGQVQTPDMVSSLYGRSDPAPAHDAFHDRCQRAHDAHGTPAERGDRGPDR